MYVENIKGRTAFVSGASAGMGEAVAKMLASNGVNLILAARRIEKLETLKNELEKNHNVKVKVIKLDFAKSEDIVKAIDSLSDEDKKIEYTLDNMEGKDYLKYKWLDINKIEEYKILPKCLKQVIKDAKFPVHCINDDLINKE